MLCPYCLRNVQFTSRPQTIAYQPAYQCPAPECAQPVSNSYVTGYKEFPPVPICVVGDRNHGKTACLASLFLYLFQRITERHWPDFYCNLIDPDETPSEQNQFREMAARLGRGELPAANQRVFPRPTLLRLTNLPGRRGVTLICYDVAGEVFQANRIIDQYANYLYRAAVVLFVFSRADSENPATEWHGLVERYVNTFDQRDAKTRRQHALVVFSKADGLDLRDAELRDALRAPDEADLHDLPAWRARRAELSVRLERWVREEQGATHFLAMIKDRFRSVRFAMVSSLGAAPEANGMVVHVTPKRLLDPVFTAIDLVCPPSLGSRFRDWFRGPRGGKA